MNNTILMRIKSIGTNFYPFELERLSYYEGSGKIVDVETSSVDSLLLFFNSLEYLYIREIYNEYEYDLSGFRVYSRTFEDFSEDYFNTNVLYHNADKSLIKIKKDFEPENYSFPYKLVDKSDIQIFWIDIDGIGHVKELVK